MEEPHNDDSRRRLPLFQTLGRMVLFALRGLWHHIVILFLTLVKWVVNIPYRRIAVDLLHVASRVLHFLVFRVFLPKRYRQLTKNQIFTIIFKADTPSGKKFDVWLLVLILLNVLLMIVESFAVGVSTPRWVHWAFFFVEWLFTLLFTFEFYLRCYCLKDPRKYVLSFFGIIDIISIFPTYLSLLSYTAQSFAVLRLLRLLRIFRIFKMKAFIKESQYLLNVLRRSAPKIGIFMLFVFIAAVILGTIVYAVENGYNDAISSIPEGVYWAVVTITTVGYGDIAPVTPIGRFISMVVMLLGYSVIAVPTGILVGETMVESKEQQRRRNERLRKHPVVEQYERVVHPQLEPGHEEDNIDDDGK